MKFEVTRDKFLPALQAATRAVGKNTIPALTGVLIEADNGLTLTCTDLERSIIAKAEADVKEPGKVLVPAKTLENIVKKLDAITLTAHDDLVLIESGGAKFELFTLPAEDFPQTVWGNAVKLATVKDYVLRDAMKQVSFAAADDHVRPILNAVLFSFTPNNLRLVATDGHRLAIKDMSVECTESSDLPVPVKTVEELGKLIKDNIKVSAVGKQIMFETGEVTLVSRLVEGQYLPYTSVIPKDYQVAAVVNRDTFLAALERTEVMATKDKHMVKLTITPDKLNVFTQSAEVGRLEEDVPAEADGEMKIAFNGRYLIEPLKAVTTNTIKLNFSGPQSVAVIQDEGYTYLVMPITIRD